MNLRISLNDAFVVLKRVLLVEKNKLFDGLMGSL
jgi:hypothetical protein